MTSDFASQEPIEFEGVEAPTFAASLNAHGMYETMRFVLRLSPRNHELMDALPNGLLAGSQISPEGVRAYSTYIHETVHWWQHVGSTSGLLYSLSYLGQSYSTIGFLREVLATFGAKKSLFRWTNEVLRAEGEAAQGKLRPANIAVNNALDIEFYKAYASSPRTAIRWLVEQIHFECVGHGYHIAYGQLLGMLQAAVDPDWTQLPKADDWDNPFRLLHEQNVEGFYHNSPVRVPPIGIRAIYEGQARFAQLQFWTRVFEHRFTCAELREFGYFNDVYVEAFDWFLKLSKSEWPIYFDDPIVSLFLLVLDIAINPTRGFPLDIEEFENFIVDVDVGIRFVALSQAVGQLPHLRTAIHDHSRDEYIEIAGKLCGATGYDHPMRALKVINDWHDKLPGLVKLMEEHRTFDFDLMNLPVRVLFSHFIAFSNDKFQRPEFFCWPGVWKTGENASSEIMRLWLRHLSLFSDRGDKPGVYPRRWPDREDKLVHQTFERFYGNMAVHDLTRQWILFDGPFTRDYEWLAETYSQERADEWAKDSFMQVYGVKLSDFDCYPKPAS